VSPAGSNELIQPGEEPAPLAGAAKCSFSVTAHSDTVLIRDKFQMAPHQRRRRDRRRLKTETHPAAGRVATATVNAFKHDQGMLGGMLKFHGFDQLITITT
jgi:hypothetical protein